jgi:hypothetical protein
MQADFIALVISTTCRAWNAKLQCRWIASTAIDDIHHGTKVVLQGRGDGRLAGEIAAILSHSAVSMCPKDGTVTLKGKAAQWQWGIDGSTLKYVDSNWLAGGG